MLAKPILDIAVGVRDEHTASLAIAAIEACGYEYRGDAGDEGGHVLVLESQPLVRTHHVHVVELGGRQWEAYLVLRDHLRASEQARDAYSAEKQVLAKRYPRDRESYTAGKNEIVAKLLGNAHARRRYTPAVRQLERDLWVADAPQRFLGLELGTRMTVVRLPGSKLMLISPVPAALDVVERVRALGSIAYLVAPNRFHHLYVGQWKEAFPETCIHVAPGLETKRSDLAIAGVLSSKPEPGWEDDVDQEVVAGFPFANEVVFFHRPSGTLVATDLAFHVGAQSAALTRLAFRAMGAYGRLSITPIERILIRDRAAFRRSIERILRWDFDRIVVTHGEVMESGGREALANTYSWILDQSAG